MCEIYSNLTMKHQNDVLDFFLVSLLLFLKRFRILFWYSIVDSEQINAGKECDCSLLPEEYQN